MNNEEVKNIIKWINEGFNENYTVKNLPNNINKIYWDFISQYQELSENFIIKYKDYVNWNYISIFQNLSESFIIKYKNEVNWSNISINQKLSRSFMIKFKDYLVWKKIKEKYNITYFDICKYINFDNNKINLNI